MTVGKKIVSHSGVYFLGNVLRYAISFVMLPIYTRMLTPAQYGTIELLSMVIDFAGIIFGLQVGEALFRFYSEYEEPREKHEVISTAMILITLLMGVGVIAIWAASGPLSTLALGGPENRNLLVLFSVTLLFQPLAEIPMTFIRARQRPWSYIFFSSLKLALQLSLNVYLVVVLKLGVRGVILSAVISGALMSLILSTYCLSVTGIRFAPAKAKMLASFSYPMIIASIISFYITFGDRYFLKLYGTLTDVGLYALGYRFGFLLSAIGTGPFFAVWDSEKYNVLKRADARQTFQKVFVLYTLFTAVVAVLISMFSRNALMIMANPEFWVASRIVPVILIAYFLQGWAGFCSLGIYVEKKTFLVTKSVFVAAALITVLYVLLIPRFGSLGAAWATVGAFGARFLYLNWKATACYDMELPWRNVLVLLPPCVAAVLVSLFGPDELIPSLAVNVLLAFSLLFSLSLMPVLPANQRLLLRRVLVRPWTVLGEIRGIIRNA